MTKGRTTTYEERIEIVSFCIERGNDYTATIEKYGVSYQQIYSWVRKYNSLFLHFENNSLFYRSNIIAELKDDFLSTQAKCRQVQPYDIKHYAVRWIVDGILRIFAPLC